MRDWQATPELRFVIRNREGFIDRDVRQQRILQQKWIGTIFQSSGPYKASEWRDVPLAKEEKSDA